MLHAPFRLAVTCAAMILPAVSHADPGVVELPLAEGAYRVTVGLRGTSDDASTVVEAESRRAVLGPLATPTDEVTEATFTVWRLSDQIDADHAIRLTDREVGIAGYDDRLTLNINGNVDLVHLNIEPAAEDVTTVFLAGDSTVTDQPGVPWSSWGAMLPRFLDENIAVANLASSGRALRSFRAERRVEKIMSLLKPGDYVFIQFGHNDMKEQGDGIGAFESYTDDLVSYVEDIRAAGGKPVLVTSMVRRRFDGGGNWYDTLGDYPEGVRRVAAERDVPLIDLFKISWQIVESLGEEPSKRMFVHYPANTFPDQPDAIKDDTHFNTYGGDLLARAVILGMKDTVPDLAAHLRDPETTIDPAAPESFEDWQWPGEATSASSPALRE